jgi:hypothetical protein
MAKQISLAQQIDDAHDFDDLKRRIRAALANIETQFNAGAALHFVDKKTDNNPAQYKQGDIVVDSSVVDGAIVIYAYDAKLNKTPLSFRSLTGSLPVSINEVFLGNGSNTTFNAQVTFVPRSTAVYKAGLRQRIGVDYIETANNKQIVFAVAPANLAVIVLDYEMVVSL